MVDTPSYGSDYSLDVNLLKRVKTLESSANAASLPSQTGHSGEFLTTDGSAPSWGPPGGTVGEWLAIDIAHDTVGLTDGIAWLTPSAGDFLWGFAVVNPDAWDGTTPMLLVITDPGTPVVFDGSRVLTELDLSQTNFAVPGGYLAPLWDESPGGSGVLVSDGSPIGVMVNAGDTTAGDPGSTVGAATVYAWVMSPPNP